MPGSADLRALPQLAGLADKYALVRSVSHNEHNHTPMIYYTLTGRHTARPDQDNDIRPPQRSDFPHLGSVVARFKPAPAGAARLRRHPGAGRPQQHQRECTSEPARRCAAAAPASSARLRSAVRQRRSRDRPTPFPPWLCRRMSRPNGSSGEPTCSRCSTADGPTPAQVSPLPGSASRPSLLTGSASRGAAGRRSRSTSEPADVRDRYGRHRFGQAMLLARRLAEAGVPMIAIHFNEMTVCDGWDTHARTSRPCKTELLPMLDQGLSALLEDLDRARPARRDAGGLLGRVRPHAEDQRQRRPRPLGRVLIGPAGRRRHPRRAGARRLRPHAAYPVSDPVDPVDIHATLYHCLGLDPRQLIYDELQRPFPISEGKVLRQLL